MCEPLAGCKHYEIITTSPNGDPFRTDTGVSLQADCELTDSNPNGDLLIPGGPGIEFCLNDQNFLSALRRHAETAERVISICSGSLLTAATGLLNGREATSHWVRSPGLKEEFPNVNWQLDHIFTQDGKFHCSAGISAGIDLALALLEEDHGRELALSVAKELVVFMHRPGNQSQFSPMLNAQSSGQSKLSRLYAAIQADPAADWRISIMAEGQNLTERSLHRYFVRDWNMAPSEYVEQARIDLSRTYLEKGNLTIKEIAGLSGFPSEQSFRRNFLKHLNTTPTAYRAGFGIDG